ncbi:MAG TPA: T9SS type A sorting domain-containing protein [Edaphocola sp.]|nr:T9SS type A sorting domain-containing protein [Edaphocola sp.]
MKKIFTLFILSFFVYNSSFGIIIGGFTQTKYRWRNNDGNQTTATWKAAENTSISLTNVTDTLRLRTEYQGDNAQGTISTGISYSKDNGATWRKITTSDTNDFKFVNSTWVTHNSNTTNQLGTSTTGIFSAGKIVSQDTPTYNVLVNSGYKTEMEWVFTPTLFVENNKTYLFEFQGVDNPGTRAQLTTNFICTNPIVSLPPVFERCGPGEITLNAISNTNGSTLIWRTGPNGAIIGYGNNIPSPFYTSNTSVYVKAFKDGCTSAGQSVNVVINALPTVNLGKNIDTCLSSTESITLNVGAQQVGSTVLWDDNSTGNTRIINQSGTYYVEVINPKNCIAYDSINVIVRKKPDVDLSVNGNTMCIGDNKPLDAGTGGQNGGTYYWNTGDQTQTIIVTSPGTYIVSVTAPNGCAQADTITVIQNGYAPTLEGIHASAIQPTTFEFEVIEPQHVIAYNWDFGNGNTSIDSKPEFTFPGDGNYLIKVLVSSACAERSDSIYVNIFGVGLNNLKELGSKINIFPNPNKTGVLNIASEKGIKINRITIYNLLGQLVNSFNVPDHERNEYQMMLPNELVNGIYNIQIETEKGLVNKKLEILK